MAKGDKAERTRQGILDSALGLITEEGFEKATIRAIAKRAGISPGAAYYYFETKEHIIHAFYEKTSIIFQKSALAGIEESEDLADGLRTVLEAQFHTSAPYHAVSRLLYRAASDPDSPLSPLSEESREMRNECIDLYRRLLDRHAPKANVRTHGTLPVVLWFLHMGLIVYWIHDKSPSARKTFKLIGKICGFIARIIKFSTLKVASPLVRSGLVILEEFPLFQEHIIEKEKPANS